MVSDMWYICEHHKILWIMPDNKQYDFSEITYTKRYWRNEMPI